MLRMPYWLPKVGSLSVSTLAKRTLGSKIAVASANAGAIILQGPHQGAQKIDQNRNVVLGGMFMESRRRQFQRFTIENRVMTFSTLRILAQSCYRYTTCCQLVYA